MQPRAQQYTTTVNAGLVQKNIIGSLNKILGKNAVSSLLIIVMVCVYGGGMHSGGHMIQNVFFKQNESPGCIHACRH